MSPAEAHFRARAPAFMRRLLVEFPQLDDLDAAAVFGNGGGESNGLTDDQEDAPTVKGSRGGRNWMQWTGPRRRAFEAFCSEHAYDPDGDEGAFAFLVFELNGPEKKALKALRAARTLRTKTIAFMKAYLRPGIPHIENRVRWAQIALEALRGKSSPPKPKPKPLVTPELLEQLQQALLDKGYPQVGQVDGKWGDKTRKAILAFEDDHDLPLTGLPSVELLAEVLAAAPKPQPAARADASPSDVRDKVPEVQASFFAKVLAMIGGVFSAAWAAITGIFGNIAGAKDLLAPVMEIGGDVPAWLWFALVAIVAGGIWWFARRGEIKGIAAFQSGERR